ncbi:nickel ABC transporter permease [Paenibacillus arenosi]|uniref:Nickel import system permease protein NikB n=1 Tax=Paenibacillus arenosi TaxID=2774142 RepID=A0ABR9AVY3_9BACL|nr:nickel ABC transporter permease [Paenibacillus arenosi]MBD8497360.1 ABC transporter permease [Paenibacillus arenosi]
MLNIVKERLLQLGIVLFFLSLFTFTLMKLAPGDPVFTILRADEVVATSADEEALRKELGLDQPVYIQYLRWMYSIMQFDFGNSLINGKPVVQDVLERLPATLELAAGSLIVMLVISIPLGIVAAKYEGKWIDHVSSVLALLGASIPAFWLGLMLIYGFSYQLGWLPTMGMGSAVHLILPSITLGFGLAAIYARMLRAGLLEVLAQDYIRTARARGIGEWRIMCKHALRAALIPVMTVLGSSVGSILAGSVIIETLFSWPGLGDMAIEAIFKRDYPVIQAYVMISGTMIVMVNLLIDISYTWIDPRVRYVKGRMI